MLNPTTGQALCIQVPLNDVLRPKKSLNISEVQALIEKGDQEEKSNLVALAHYFKAVCMIESAEPQVKGLLMRAMCYLKSAKLQFAAGKDNSGDIKEARRSIEEVFELYLGASQKECNNGKFLFLLGSACLAFQALADEVEFLSKARACFQKAVRLLDRELISPSSSKHEDPDCLRHKILLGLALAHFYQAKNEINDQGTSSREKLLDQLEISRTYLEQAFVLHEAEHMRYVLALNHALTAFFIEKEQAVEVNCVKITALKQKSIRQKSIQHLNIAVQILDVLSKKNLPVLQLLGILKYKLAFGCLNDEGAPTIDWMAGMEAENHLSFVHRASLVEDSSLLLCLADCVRQLAWLSQAEVYQKRADEFLIDASSEGLLGDTLLWIYSIQRELFVLLKKVPVIKETLKDINQSISKLEANLKTPTKDVYFKRLKSALRKELELLKRDYLGLTILPESPPEIKKYSLQILKIGDKFNALFISVLLEYALVERVRIFNLVLDWSTSSKAQRGGMTSSLITIYQAHRDLARTRRVAFFFFFAFFFAIISTLFRVQP